MELQYTLSNVFNIHRIEPSFQARFDPLLIMQVSVYLNLTLAYELSHRGWISFIESLTTTNLYTIILITSIGALEKYKFGSLDSALWPGPKFK